MNDNILYHALARSRTPGEQPLQRLPVYGQNLRVNPKSKDIRICSLVMSLSRQVDFDYGAAVQTLLSSHRIVS